MVLSIPFINLNDMGYGIFLVDEIITPSFVGLFELEITQILGNRKLIKISEQF